MADDPTATAATRTVIARRYHREHANQIVEDFVDRGHSRREFSIEFDQVPGEWVVYVNAD